MKTSPYTTLNLHDNWLQLVTMLKAPTFSHRWKGFCFLTIRQHSNPLTHLCNLNRSLHRNLSCVIMVTNPIVPSKTVYIETEGFRIGKSSSHINYNTTTLKCHTADISVWHASWSVYLTNKPNNPQLWFSVELSKGFTKPGFVTLNSLENCCHELDHRYSIAVLQLIGDSAR